MTEADIVTYFYTIEGTAAGGQTWETDGTVDTIGRGEFMKAVKEAMHRSFIKITNGDAVFGHPGLGCVGPYAIISLTITERTTAQ